MIEVVHLSKRFHNQQVLEDISCRFERGQTNLIIGQSGSGKTVLLKCIVGLLTPTEGDVFYDETPFTRTDFQEKKKIRQQIGMPVSYTHLTLPTN